MFLPTLLTYAGVRNSASHPINVLIMVHMEDISSMCGWNKSVNPNKTAWEERNENLNWLLKYVLSLSVEKRPKLLLEFNGDFAEKMLRLKNIVLDGVYTLYTYLLTFSEINFH
jgi:hypothetical protein